jgi:hypothetical protein
MMLLEVIAGEESHMAGARSLENSQVVLQVVPPHVHQDHCFVTAPADRTYLPAGNGSKMADLVEVYLLM